MVEPLRRVLVCTPEAAGWTGEVPDAQWRSLGFATRPDCGLARRQHDQLVALLHRHGCEVECLGDSPGFTLDAVYVHDASFMTDHGAICLSMGKQSRAVEPWAHRDFYQRRGIPVLGEIMCPGSVEAGDLVWLSEAVLLAGRGYRTNPAGIACLQELLDGVRVVPAPLPHWDGPGACLHLMSLLSLLDARTAIVDISLLAVEIVELLEKTGYRLIGMDPSERATLGCNVLALGNRKVIALAENARTNDRLRAAGFEVFEFEGSEIAINGGGGPTCLTRPIRRRS